MSAVVITQLWKEKGITSLGYAKLFANTDSKGKLEAGDKNFLFPLLSG